MEVAGVLATALQVVPMRVELADNQRIGPVHRYDTATQTWVPNKVMPTLQCRKGQIALFQVPHIPYDLQAEVGKPPPDGPDARFAPSQWLFRGCENGPVTVQAAYNAACRCHAMTYAVGNAGASGGPFSIEFGQALGRAHVRPAPGVNVAPRALVHGAAQQGPAGPPRLPGCPAGYRTRGKQQLGAQQRDGAVGVARRGVVGRQVQRQAGGREPKVTARVVGGLGTSHRWRGGRWPRRPEQPGHRTRNRAQTHRLRPARTPAPAAAARGNAACGFQRPAKVHALVRV